MKQGREGRRERVSEGVWTEWTCPHECVLILRPKWAGWGQGPDPYSGDNIIVIIKNNKHKQSTTWAAHNVHRPNGTE